MSQIPIRNRRPQMMDYNMQIKTPKRYFVMNMRHFLFVKCFTNYSMRIQDTYNFLIILGVSKNTSALKLYDRLMVNHMFPNHIARGSNYLETTSHNRTNTNIHNDVC